MPLFNGTNALSKIKVLPEISAKSLILLEFIKKPVFTGFFIESITIDLDIEHSYQQLLVGMRHRNRHLIPPCLQLDPNVQL